MPTVDDIITYITGLSGHPLNRDEGVHHGEATRHVTGVTVCWMATPAAIEEAGHAGHQLLLAHESLYYPYDAAAGAPAPAGWQDWPTNRGRRERLARHDLTFLRVHGSLDEICIFDDFAAALDLGAPVVAEGAYGKVYEIDPCTLDELVARVRSRLPMAAMRVCPAGQLPTPASASAARPAERPRSTKDSPQGSLRRVGLPWGGMGLFVNVAYQQELIALGCDAFIAGETDNYGFRFAEECGIPTIETSHELSENPGLRHFTAMLAAAFPGLDVRFFETPCVWEVR